MLFDSSSLANSFVMFAIIITWIFMDLLQLAIFLIFRDHLAKPKTNQNPKRYPKVFLYYLFISIMFFEGLMFYVTTWGAWLITQVSFMPLINTIILGLLGIKTKIMKFRSCIPWVLCQFIIMVLGIVIQNLFPIIIINNYIFSISIFYIFISYIPNILFILQIELHFSIKKKATSLITCPKCGKSILNGTKFCTFCDAEIELELKYVERQRLRNMIKLP
jgi:hypothetical protein